MKNTLLSRFLCFALIVGVTLFWDLFTKKTVFDDLGYPAGDALRHNPGQHEIFARPGQREGESRPYLTGWVKFRLNTSFNRGALWGIGQGYSWLFALLSGTAIVGILYWLFARKGAASLWLTVSLSLIMAGTLGNLFDRLGLHGCLDPYNLERSPIRAVREFLRFTFGSYEWPVFNFADVYLVTGAVMLVLQSLFGLRSHPPGPAESPDGT